MSVWSSLVGQQTVIESLSEAARGKGMTHAWLITGPPGSGRSNAALAFAAALQCESAGCGECEACHTTLARTHPDVSVKSTDRVIIAVDDARSWVREASLKPVRDRWQILIVEDADRLNDSANNALLKAIEEPGAKTVWILCAPHTEDVLPTIRSRSRHIRLSTPAAADVTAFLVDRHGVTPALAAHAARASQGHIGRARALATDEDTRGRRREIVLLPARLHGLGDCMNAAANLADMAKQESESQLEALGKQGLRDIEAVYGSDNKGRSSRSARAAVGDLEKQQKARSKRYVFDVIDRALMDLLSFYRDVLLVQHESGLELVNEEMRDQVVEFARRTTPEDNLRRIDAVYEAREQMMEFNTPPLLALESMMIALRVG